MTDYAGAIAQLTVISRPLSHTQLRASHMTGRSVGPTHSLLWSERKRKSPIERPTELVRNRSNSSYTMVN